MIHAVQWSGSGSKSKTIMSTLYWRWLVSDHVYLHYGAAVSYEVYVFACTYDIAIHNSYMVTGVKIVYKLLCTLYVCVCARVESELGQTTHLGQMGHFSLYGSVGQMKEFR